MKKTKSANEDIKKPKNSDANNSISKETNINKVEVIKEENNKTSSAALSVKNADQIKEILFKREKHIFFYKIALGVWLIASVLVYINLNKILNNTNLMTKYYQNYIAVASDPFEFSAYIEALRSQLLSQFTFGALMGVIIHLVALYIFKKGTSRIGVVMVGIASFMGLMTKMNATSGDALTNTISITQILVDVAIIYIMVRIYMFGSRVNILLVEDKKEPLWAKKAKNQ